MFDDKVLVIISNGANTYIPVWISDGIGPWDSRKEEQNPPYINPSAGEASLAGSGGTTYLSANANVIYELTGLPRPANCREGANGRGWYYGPKYYTLSQGPISWRVLEIA